MTGLSTRLSASGRELRADRFHTGVRFASLAVWLAAVALVYLAGRWLLTAIFGSLAGGWMVLLALGAVFLAQPLAYLGEKELVALWPSGRALELEAGALSLRERSGTVRMDLLPAGKVNFWRWRFVVRGRQGGRVPNGHYCFAIRLVQNDASFSLYAFLSPKQADALAARYAFYELRRATEAGKRTLSGREAVYVAAEKKRWESGAELDPADFETLLAHLAAYVPEFAATSAS